MNAYIPATLAGLLLVTLPMGTVHGDEPAAAEAPQTVQIFDAGKLTIPAGWKSQQVRSRIIEHEFVAPTGDAEDAATARVTMMAAGGDVDANISRWRGQFTGTPDAKTEKLQVAGMTVHLVELEGSYKDTMGGGPFAGGKTVVRDDYGMLGAIIVTQDGRQYFVKMTGPKEAVEAHRKGFKAMLKGIQA